MIFVVAAISTSLPTCSAFNLTYPAVFNFGDSNSDTGGLVAGVAFPVGPPNGQNYFRKPSGRFCNGRLLVDFLSCNFVAGGSTILPSTTPRTPFSFGIQVAQFIRFKARVLELLTNDDYYLKMIMICLTEVTDLGLILGTKLQKYLPLENYFKQGLYMVDMGQNDLDGAFYFKSEDQVLDLSQKFCQNLRLELRLLYGEGARNFWIHNTGPFGCLPRIIATFGKNESKLDQLGCVGSHNRAAGLFNTQLHDLCASFRDQFADANVTYVDIFSVKWNLISNFASYGFKQPLAACCGHGGPPLNFDSRIACGETRILNGSKVTESPCNNTAEYINWDGNHYTEAANRVVSEQVLAEIRMT
ncbi:hypothetical protein K2173_004711 [Erythroxylum novogranatense]|uniref:GDSL esterase/lipase n=1 Tax=Erythroxylum novogranatense TaxID=1862640 RepID=A0AAV8UBJ2_9ROSI|nr:hypothetical protein K2173_004711 [Erythroxylum novogranatense]